MEFVKATDRNTSDIPPRQLPCSRRLANSREPQSYQVIRWENKTSFELFLGPFSTWKQAD
jgi:hypothetical protein